MTFAGWELFMLGFFSCYGIGSLLAHILFWRVGRRNGLKRGWRDEC